MMTMHSSEGLGLPFVAVSGVSCTPCGDAEPEADAELLRIAMTCATDRLRVTAHEDEGFVADVAA